jgi:SAM-dependent methyltransferase
VLFRSDVVTNHHPEPKEHSGVVLVGDYLFDSTLNGLFDSSDAATDILVTEFIKLRDREKGGTSDKIDRAYFDNYRNTGKPYAEVWQEFTDPDYIVDLMNIVWRPKKPFRMLVAGSASGELVGALRERGIDAWGVENNRYIHAKTPKALRKYNKLGSITDLPFKANAFDYVYETALAHLSPRQSVNAIRELHRVVKSGLIFGSVTSDLTTRLIDKYDLLRGVKRLATWWEWSEMIFANGFDLTMNKRDSLDAVWAKTLAANKGPGVWFEDAESLRYSFFDKVDEDDED